MLTDIDCEVLESSDVDGALLRGVQVAAPDAEVAGGTHHAARQPQRIVRQDRFSCSVVILPLNAYKDEYLT